MLARVYLLILYVALWGAALSAPSAPEPLWPHVLEMATLSGPDPWTAACFNLMGIWPLAYAGVLLLDGPGQRVPAWPFVLGSFFGGMFVLTPYLLLRCSGQPTKDAGWIARLARGRGLGAIVLASTAGLITFAALTGSAADLATAARSSGFVWTFLADFAVFWLAFGVVLQDDLRRFGQPSTRLGWAAIPLLGPALHLLSRGASVAGKR